MAETYEAQVKKNRKVCREKEQKKTHTHEKANDVLSQWLKLFTQAPSLITVFSTTGVIKKVALWLFSQSWQVLHGMTSSTLLTKFPEGFAIASFSLQPGSLANKSRMDTELYLYALSVDMSNVNMPTL